MTPFRLLVAGSRECRSEEGVFRALNYVVTARLPRPNHPLLVMHGACPEGVDYFAHAWAVSLAEHEFYQVAVDPQPADWDCCTASCRLGHRKQKRPGDMVHPGRLDDYCPSAGPRRNSIMVGRGHDLMLAMPGPGLSMGTRGCMKMAKRAGIEILEMEW